MSRKAIVATVLLAMVASACGASPEELATQFQDAINSGDINSALGLLADDAVLQVDGTQSAIGKSEIENWLAAQAELNFRIEGAPTASASGAAFESCSISSDMWRYFKINPMSGTCEVAFEGELITSFSLQFDDDAKARLSDSPAATIDDLVGIWTARSPLPGGDPHAGETALYYLQFGEDGSARLAVTPNDLLIAPDSGHPGARLTWTYEDYVLTVRNEGSASEGYCQEQELGTYLVRNVKSVPRSRMQFNPIKDSCAFRTATLRHVGASWDPYVP